MPDYFYPSLFSSHHRTSGGWAIVLFVICMHILLLVFGYYWPSPVSEKPKIREKVHVQTIQLTPHHPSSLTPIIIPTEPIVMPELPKEIVEGKLAIEEKSVEEKPVPSNPLALNIPEEISPAPIITPPKPLANEVKPKQKAPPKPNPEQKKPSTKKSEVKPEIKPTVPAKKTEPTPKPVDPAKKTTADATKIREAEQKKQQEEKEKKRQEEIAAVQETARLKQQILMAKAKENLAKMSETRDKLSVSSSVSLEKTTLPKELNQLQIDTLTLGENGDVADWGTKEITYRDEVAYRLKMALKLPDYGAVKINLTLNRSGKVIKVETIHSESIKNKIYIERTLPTLMFPPFGQRFRDIAQYTFQITLHND